MPDGTAAAELCRRNVVLHRKLIRVLNANQQLNFILGDSMYKKNPRSGLAVAASACMLNTLEGVHDLNQEAPEVLSTKLTPATSETPPTWRGFVC